MNTRSFLLSSLIAGVVIGILGNLPVLNIINCCLCIFVWVGGFLAVFLYKRFQKGVMDLSSLQGAGLGALSGLIGAFVGVVVYALTSFISGPLFTALARLLQIQSDVSFLTGDGRSLIVSAFFFLTLNAILYPIFGALSALIAANLMKTKPQT